MPWSFAFEGRFAASRGAEDEEADVGVTGGDDTLAEDDDDPRLKLGVWKLLEDVAEESGESSDGTNETR